MNRLFQHLYMPPDLAIEFMVTFSRMEYALKSTGYAIGSERKVDPAWDRFANDIHDQFNHLNDERLLQAKKFLLENPPKKQILQIDQVVFQNQYIDEHQRSTQQLIKFVRTVRNNLFHGGKYLPNVEQETGRNKALVGAALIVLKACIELNQSVKNSYEN